MIICRDCGHENEEDDQFCGSCGAFLEWTGSKVEEAVSAESAASEDANSDPTLLERVKKAVGVDEESIEEHRQSVHQQLADETANDQTVADQINAEREAKAEAERRAAAEEAARVAAENAERERRDAEAAVQQAEAEAERLRIEATRAEEARVAKAAEETARLEREAKLAAEAEQARRLQEIEEAKRKAEEEAEQARARAEEDARAQQAAAEEAQRREEEAERHRKEAEAKVAAAAAAAAAAALRAAQETDAIAAADAAKLLAEADAAKARSESEAATAIAQEEAARARAELAAAKAESAKLRNEAEQRSADAQIQKARSDAEIQAARAREDAERKAAADAELARRTAEAEADAAAIRAKAEAAAKAKEAEAEAMRLRAEAAAAKARAEAEQARQKAEAEAAARAREEALKRAAALVAKPQESPAAGTASKFSTSAKPGAAAQTAGGASTGKDGGKAAKGNSESSAQPVAVAPSAVQPEAQRPGSEKVRPAAKKSANREVNPGDLICGNCGTGNPPARKFCRKCGTTLAEAVVAKVGFFARLKRKFSRKKSHEAGYRPKAGSAGANAGLGTKGRVAWFRLNSKLMKVGAFLGVLAAFGFGVEPIRQKLQLPNVRQAAINKVRELAKPVYDPVRPASAKASSSASGRGPEFVIDAGSNTYWSAGPSSDGGVGNKLTISFDKPFDLGRVLLTSGVSGSNEPGAGFVSQPRPSELRFTLNDDVASATTVGVKDIPEPQQLVVKGKEVTKLEIEVTGVYPSAQGKGKSVSITEVEFFQKRKIGDDFETLPLAKTTVTSGNELAKFLTDDDLATAWVSAADNDGVDQGFTLNFAEPVDLDRIRIAGGSSEADFKASPRPHELQLVLTCERACEPTKQVSLKDKWGYKNVELTARGVTSIQFQVRSVYGAGGGVSVAEVQLQRKRPKPL